MDWPTVIAAAGAAGAGAVGTGRFLVNLAAKGTRIEDTLEDHGRRLDRIEKKMPNGEIEETFEMVKEMYAAFKRQ